jgi:hypothetical protein
MTLESNFFALQSAALGCLMIVAPQIPVEGTFSYLSSSGTTDGVSGRDVAMVYVQVIGFLYLQMTVLQCPGPRGLLMACLAIIAGMLYHIFVKNVMPPVPVMVGVGVVLVSSLYSGRIDMGKHTSKLSINVFMAWNCIQALVFFLTARSGTGTPGVVESFPMIADIEGGLRATNVLCEVISTYSLCLIVLQCPGAMGRAMANILIFGLTAYHYSTGISPPVPVVAANLISGALSCFAVISTPAKATKSERETQ